MEEANAAFLKSKIRGLRTNKSPRRPEAQQQNQPKISKLKERRNKKEGHVVKFSADVYKSKKGQGDTLKAGRYEPFAYIKLNPKMLNKRFKEQAVKSFEDIVSHGKQKK